MWLKKFLSPNDSDWKLFSKFMNEQNLNIFLLSHFDLTELPLKIPDFYKEHFMLGYR